MRGIGEKKAAKLFMKYKTIANLRAASAEELAQTAGVSTDVAQELKKVISEL